MASTTDLSVFGSGGASVAITEDLDVKSGDIAVRSGGAGKLSLVKGAEVAVGDNVELDIGKSLTAAVGGGIDLATSSLKVETGGAVESFSSGMSVQSDGDVSMVTVEDATASVRSVDLLADLLNLVSRGMAQPTSAAASTKTTGSVDSTIGEELTVTAESTPCATTVDVVASTLSRAGDQAPRWSRRARACSWFGQRGDGAVLWRTPLARLLRAEVRGLGDAERARRHRSAAEVRRGIRALRHRLRLHQRRRLGPGERQLV